MRRRPPRSTRTDTLLPYATLFRSPPLAQAPQLGRAGLVVDENGDARDVAQLALDLVQVRTRMNGDPFAERAGGILVRVVRHDYDARRAFCRDLRGDALDRQLAIHRLSTGHGHGVVDQDLVRDVDAGSYRRAHGPRAGMELGAVTENLKDVSARRIARTTDSCPPCALPRNVAGVTETQRQHQAVTGHSGEATDKTNRS